MAERRFGAYLSVDAGVVRFSTKAVAASRPATASTPLVNRHKVALRSGTAHVHIAVVEGLIAPRVAQVDTRLIGCRLAVSRCRG